MSKEVKEGERYKGHRPLSDKHTEFVMEYINNRYRAYVAYQKVYPDSNNLTARSESSKILANPYAQDLIKEEREKFRISLNIDREWLVDQYLELMNSCVDNGQDGSGEIVDRSNWNKSLAQLAKLLGLDEPDKLDVSIREYIAKFGE